MAEWHATPERDRGQSIEGLWQVRLARCQAVVDVGAGE